MADWRLKEIDCFSNKTVLMLALNSKEYARSEGIKREEEIRQLEKRNLDLTENMKRLQEVDERQSNKLWEKDKKITELEKNLDGFGKLAIEKDVLKRELESTRLLLGDTGSRSQNCQDHEDLLKTIEAQKLEIKGKEQKLKQLNLQIAGYGELAVKKEILDRELESLRIIMKHNKEDEFQKLETECQNLRVELESSKMESNERLLECERLGNQVEELKEKLMNWKMKDVERESQILELNKQACGFEETMRESEIKFDKLRTNLEAEHKIEVDLLAEENKKLSEEVKEAKLKSADVEQLHHNIFRFEGMLHKKSKELQDLNDQLADKEMHNASEILKLKELLSISQKERDDQIRAISVEMEDLNDENQKLRKKLHEMNTDLKEKSDMLEKFESGVMVTESLVKPVKADLLTSEPIAVEGEIIGEIKDLSGQKHTIERENYRTRKDVPGKIRCGASTRRSGWKRGQKEIRR